MAKHLENRSKFAQTLQQLLDGTNIFTRTQWAGFLNVSQAAISQWVNDKSVPRPELLRMIVELVRSRDGKPTESTGKAPKEVLREFEEMASLPAQEVSPNWERFGDSVSAYMVAPFLEGFLLDLKSLDPEAQRRVLLRSSRLCAAEAGYDVEPQPQNVPGNGQMFRVHKPTPDTRLSEEAVAAVQKFEKNIPGFLHVVMTCLTSQIGRAHV